MTNLTTLEFKQAIVKLFMQYNRNNQCCNSKNDGKFEGSMRNSGNSTVKTGVVAGIVIDYECKKFEASV